MIKSFEQCVGIQERRVSKKKRGYSKSVRNFLLKNHSDSYDELKGKLPVTWEKSENKERSVIHILGKIFVNGQVLDNSMPL